MEEARFTLRSWRRPKKKPEAKSRGSKSKGAKSQSSRKLSVTVSIGMADNGAAASETAAVLKQADQALYRAKKRGRNRVSK